MALDFTKIKAKLDAIAEGFENAEAKAGWFPSARYPDGTSVAYVATIQEMGAPEVSIPARPFIRPTIDANKGQWVADLGRGVQAVIAERIDANSVLEQMGGVIAGDIQSRIASNSVAPLSPTTILLRKWRREGMAISGKTVGEAAAAVAADPSLINGVNADPLQDTGLLVATLTHAVGAPE